MVSHSLVNTNNCERFDARLEEQEKEEKTKGLEHGSDWLLWVVRREKYANFCRSRVEFLAVE